jgi:hypothetical protein
MTRSIWGRRETRWFIYGVQLASAANDLAEHRHGWALYHLACYASLYLVVKYAPSRSTPTTERAP